MCVFFCVSKHTHLQTHYLGSPMGKGLVVLQIWKWYVVRLIYCVTFTRMMKQSLALTIYRHTTVYTDKHVPASRTDAQKHHIYMPCWMCKWLLCTLIFVGTSTNHTNRTNTLRWLLLSQEVMNCLSDCLWKFIVEHFTCVRRVREVLNWKRWSLV